MGQHIWKPSLRDESKVDTVILNTTTGSGHIIFWPEADRYAAILQVVLEDCALKTTRQLVFQNVFFFYISLSSWGWQGAVCSLQWPLDDRATLRAIRSLISPCRPLQKGLSSIKVKINDWKRDSKSLLCVRWCLVCGQGNHNQAQKKTKTDFSSWVLHRSACSVLQKATQNTASRWHYWITPNWHRDKNECLFHVILTSIFKRSELVTWAGCESKVRILCKSQNPQTQM